VKRTVLGIFALATLAFVPPAAGEDIDAWQDAKWGMTPDEVQKVLSYPTSVVDLAKVCGEKCEDGAALELEDYVLDGQHFVVRFWFANPELRLHTVSMYAKQPGSGNNDGGFAKMKGYLEDLYNSPRSTELRHGYFIVSWELASKKITLYSNTTDTMSVVYEKTSEKGSEGSSSIR
jgi:hypothetical protein